MQLELDQFFKSYANAYLFFKAGALVHFFHFPCLIHDLAGIHLLQCKDDLHAYEEKFLQNLKQLQITRIENKIIEYDWTESLPSAVGCKLSYQLYDSNSNLVLDCDYSYSLVREVEWKIVFARLGAIRKS